MGDLIPVNAWYGRKPYRGDCSDGSPQFSSRPPLLRRQENGLTAEMPEGTALPSGLHLRTRLTLATNDESASGPAALQLVRDAGREWLPSRSQLRI